MFWKKTELFSANARQISFFLYRGNWEALVIKRNEIVDSFLKGVVKSGTEWAALIAPFLKKDGLQRVLGGYKKNPVTKRDFYLKPCVDECIDLLCEALAITILETNCRS